MTPISALQRRNRSSRFAAVVLCAATACASALFAVTAPASADAVRSPSPDMPAAPAASDLPAEGDCTNSPTWGPFVMDGGVVDCSEEYTGLTIHVGKWSSRVSPAKADSMSYRQRGRVVDQLRWEINECGEARAEYLGLEIAPDVYRESQFYVYITGPNPEQWEAGQRWLRCDIVAFKHPRDWDETDNSWLNLPTRLQSLPSPAALKGILAKPDLGSFANCQAQRTGTGWYEMFSCRKGIEIVASIGFAERVPNTEENRKQVRKRCVSVVNKITGKAVGKDRIIALSSGCPTASSSWVCGLSRS